MRLQPALVHRLMRKVTDELLEFYSAAPLGLRGDATFGSDDVNCSLISPEDYREFVHPYEAEIAELFERIYYHSCGNLTPIFEDLLELPNIHKIHVSPWSDLAAAKQIIGDEVIVQKFMDPQRDIEQCDEAEMRGRLSRVLDLSDGIRLEIGVPGETLKGIEFTRIAQAELVPG
jgi:uroporphyrinogen-III decarboxylase